RPGTVLCFDAPWHRGGARTVQQVRGAMPVGGPGEFGERLRRLRIVAGLTQEALAEQAGLSARGIADLERGARRFPRAATIRRLADALGLSAADQAGLIAAGQKATEPSASQVSSAASAPAASPRSTRA